MNEPVAEYESIIRRTENNSRVPTSERERDEFLRNLITTKKSTFSSIWPTEGKGRTYEISSFLHSRHTLKLEVIGILLAILLIAIMTSTYFLLTAPVQRLITALPPPSRASGPNEPPLPKLQLQPSFATATGSASRGHVAAAPNGANA